MSGSGGHSRRAGFAALLFAMTFLGPWPGAIQAASAEDSHPKGVTETCPEVFPGDDTEWVKKVTDPTPGSTVQPGQTIKVKLVWDKDKFKEAELHKVLDCVKLDGEILGDLSLQEKPAANDGLFEHEYQVPDDAPAGAKLCDRGMATGQGEDGDFHREKTELVCFEVGPKSNDHGDDDGDDHHGDQDGDKDGATPPDTTPTTTPPPPPPPDNGIPPAPQTPTQVLPERLQEALPAVVPAAIDTDNTQPAVVQPTNLATLPTTGQASRVLTLVAGLSLFAGGAGIAGGARRRRRR